jgi:hypothetical protein
LIRFLLTLAAVLLLFGSSSRTAHAQSFLGFSFTQSSVTLSGDPPPNGVFRGRTSYAVRVGGGLEIADGIHLTALPGWASRGTDVEFRVSGLGAGIAFSELAIDYVTLPIGLRVLSRSNRIFVSSIIDVGYLTSATYSTVTPSPFLVGQPETTPTEQDVLANLNPWDVSVALAVGVRIPVGRPALAIEFGWGQSLINVTNNDFLPVDWTLPPRFKFSGFGLSAGLEFDLGDGGRDDGGDR